MDDPNPTPTFSDEELEFLDSVFELARLGQTEQLMTYIASGVPVNLTNSRGDSLLILAAYHRHVDTVDALLDAGAHTDRVNEMGQTALSAATFRNDEPIVRRLLHAGADPALGPTNALAVAKQFELTDMAVLLKEFQPSKTSTIEHTDGESQ